MLVDYCFNLVIWLKTLKFKKRRTLTVYLGCVTCVTNNELLEFKNTDDICYILFSLCQG